MRRSGLIVVVGGGPAGLAASSRLARAGCAHVVLERDQIGSSWRTQRWDSFRLNTPRWANRVPGKFLDGPADSFVTADALVAAFERLAARLPVVEGAEVFGARRIGSRWRVDSSRGPLLADAVVVASGFQNVPRRPAYASALPREIAQLHAADYRRPDDVESGVLVVGGGQSGVQIADDLLNAGKRVYLATSRVGRLPRRYRGRDSYEWLRDNGQLDLPRHEADPITIAGTPPQVAGGRTLSYQHLAARGATLLGRAAGADGYTFTLGPEVGENVRFADEASAKLRASWDKRAQLVKGEAHSDPADEPAPQLYDAVGPATLDLRAARISSVIWATGFTPSTAWLPEDALDDRHQPQLPGLHVVGAPWLTHRSSANLYGMATDAELLARALTRVPASAAA